MFGPQDEDSEADEDVPDPSEISKVANSIRSTPFSRKAIIPLSAAAQGAHQQGLGPKSGPSALRP
jgi:hypothetical protein